MLTSSVRRLGPAGALAAALLLRLALALGLDNLLHRRRIASLQCRDRPGAGARTAGAADAGRADRRRGCPSKAAASMTLRGSRSCGLRSRLRLRLRGSARPPRAWRAYSRMARLSAISASARCSRVSSAPCGQRRKAESGGIETPIVGAADLREHGLGGRAEARGRDPDRLVPTLRIELLEGGAVGLLGSCAAGRRWQGAAQIPPRNRAGRELRRQRLLGAAAEE